jgi:heptosyltransferase I
MHIAILKISSFGDILHTLPTLSDLKQAFPDAQITWIIDENFAEIAQWHPAVDHIISLPIRRMKQTKNPIRLLRELSKIKRVLKSSQFDVVLDLQGLWKTALLSRYCSGTIHGLDKDSIRERSASRFYHTQHHLSPLMHAITRSRQLAAAALNYTPNPKELNYGIEPQTQPQPKTLFFAHGTTWQSKHWPDNHWHELTQLAIQSGYKISLTYGNDQEQQRALLIKQLNPEAITLIERTNLSQLKTHLEQIEGIISVDTGLFHLACALGLPGLALFGASNPERVCGLQSHQAYLNTQLACQPCNKRQCSQSTAPFAPCLTRLSPQQVWQRYLACLQSVKTKTHHTETISL